MEPFRIPQPAPFSKSYSYIAVNGDESNSGHRDFVFATRALPLRYLVRLYVKALENFAGSSADQLLERMFELSLYAEEAQIGMRPCRKLRP